MIREFPPLILRWLGPQLAGVFRSDLHPKAGSVVEEHADLLDMG